MYDQRFQLDRQFKPRGLQALMGGNLPAQPYPGIRMGGNTPPRYQPFNPHTGGPSQPMQMPQTGGYNPPQQAPQMSGNTHPMQTGGNLGAYMSQPQGLARMFQHWNPYRFA